MAANTKRRRKPRVGVKVRVFWSDVKFAFILGCAVSSALWLYVMVSRGC